MSVNPVTHEHLRIDHGSRGMKTCLNGHCYSEDSYLRFTKREVNALRSISNRDRRRFGIYKSLHPFSHPAPESKKMPFWRFKNTTLSSHPMLTTTIAYFFAVGHKSMELHYKKIGFNQYRKRKRVEGRKMTSMH